MFSPSAADQSSDFINSVLSARNKTNEDSFERLRTGSTEKLNIDERKFAKYKVKQHIQKMTEDSE